MNIINAQTETKAAIYAEGTKCTKADILKAYRQHEEEVDIQTFCEEVLEIGGLDVPSLIERYSGFSLRDPQVATAFAAIDFTDYYPVIDADLVLTGQFVYADGGNGDWSNYDDEAAIRNDVAREGGWKIEDGYASPPEG